MIVTVPGTASSSPPGPPAGPLPGPLSGSPPDRAPDPLPGTLSGSPADPLSQPPAATGRAAPAGIPLEAEVMARAGTENFPVALRVLPRRRRDGLLAIYGYARLVDQLGDAYAGDRLAALDWLEAQLDAALGQAPSTTVHPVVARIAGLVRSSGAGERQLRDLIAANRMDQTVHRYATFEDLLGYCHLSADPVGRLVLLAFDASDERRVAWSDRICTALQLAEHWQDLAEDLRAGRCYLPADDLERFGVGDDQLAAAVAGGRAGTALRGLVAFEVARARRILAEGAPLVADLRGGARVAVAGFAGGGQAALDAVADCGFDPFAGTPRPSRARTLRHATALLVARTGGRP